MNSKKPLFELLIRTYRIGEDWYVDVYENYYGVPRWKERIYNNRESYPDKNTAEAVARIWLRINKPGDWGIAKLKYETWWD